MDENVEWKMLIWMKLFDDVLDENKLDDIYWMNFFDEPWWTSKWSSDGTLIDI
jgi:hypothetical protein